MTVGGLLQIGCDGEDVSPVYTYKDGDPWHCKLVYPAMEAGFEGYVGHEYGPTLHRLCVDAERAGWRQITSGDVLDLVDWARWGVDPLRVHVHAIVDLDHGVADPPYEQHRRAELGSLWICPGCIKGLRAAAAAVAGESEGR